MIVVGIIVSETPRFTGKCFIILIARSTRWIKKIGILLKGKLCFIDLIIYFDTRNILSIYGTCSLEITMLTHGTPGILCINAWSGTNSISTRGIVIRKPRLM